MSGTHLRIAVLNLLALTLTAQAGPDLFDLVPEDAPAALVMRNVDELRKKGDELIADAGLRNMGRPSELFESLIKFLDLQGKIETDGRAAVVIVNPTALGIEAWDKEGRIKNEVIGPRFMDLIVVAATVKDRDATAANFNLNKGGLTADTLITVDGGNFGKFIYLRDNLLFIGRDGKAVTSAAKGKRAGADLQGARNWAFKDADAFLMIQRKPLEPVWKDMLRSLTRELQTVAGEDNQKAAQQFIDALAAIDATYFALRVDKGIGVRWVNTFPKKMDEGVAKFLAALSVGAGGANLTGLPEGQVLLAEAFRGDGAKNATVMRMVFSSFLGTVSRDFGWVSDRDRWTYAGVFTEIWKLLRGGRFAVYQNPDKSKHGLLGGVAIMETEDPEKFLRELRAMIGLAADAPSEAERKERAPSLAQLIRDLGDDQYTVRESASTKLALVGEAALPLLEKAQESEDLEVRRRAKMIKDQIVSTVAERRKELLAQDVAVRIRPTFAFSPKPEIAAGKTVEVIRVKLGEKDAAMSGKFRELFGPDCDRLRLAVQGKRVVILLGSDQELLQKTLTNLQENKPGLAATKPLSISTAQRNPANKLEFHLSLAKAFALWTAADVEKAGKQGGENLTAFALTVDPGFLEMDLWLPAKEIQVFEQLQRR